MAADADAAAAASPGGRERVRAKAGEKGLYGPLLGRFHWAEWTDGSHRIVAVDGQDRFEGAAGIIFTPIQAVINSQMHPAPAEENHLQSHTRDPNERIPSNLKKKKKTYSIQII